MKTPPHLLALMMASTMAALPGDGPIGRRRRIEKKKAVDKRKRAKRRQARASKKRNRR